MTTQVSPSFIVSFSKAQIAAVAATLADWAVLFILVEWLHLWYVPAVGTGSMVGAVVNFLLNRHWSFQATHDHWHEQAIRYTGVSLMSAALNSAGCYGMTDYLKFHYALSVLVVSMLVGVFFNYPLHRYFVFKRSTA